MQLRVMRSASMCSEDSSPSCSSEEELYTSWQPHYEAATRFLQTCLYTNVQGGALRWVSCMLSQKPPRTWHQTCY